MTAAVMMNEPDISDVLPQARQLVRELGSVPSRNTLKASLRVGGKKASAVWRALLAEVGSDQLGSKPAAHREPTRARTAEPAEASPAPGPSLTPDPVGVVGSEPEPDSDADRVRALNAAHAVRMAQLRAQAPQASPTGPDPDHEPTPSPDPVDVDPDPSPVSPVEPKPAPGPLDVLDPDDTDPTWVGSGPVSPAGPSADPDGLDWNPWDFAEPVRPLPDPSPPRAEPAPGPTGRATEPSEPVRSEPTDQAQAQPVKPFPRWPLVVLALGAFVAVWSGWVGIGRLTGFGLVNLLPGIIDDGKWSTIDTAITLPIGVEAYGAFALSAFLSDRIPQRARLFAGWSAAGSLLVGAAGQAAYHLLVSHPSWLIHNADGTMSAPAPIVVAVSALPVAVLGMGAALAHLMRQH